MNSQPAETVPITELVKDASGGNIKVPKGNYNSSGAYPVVDQGQSVIGGYTEDPTCIVDGDGPWIIFGDHTRKLKFIDFSFCMGADGVKVLTVKNPTKCDPKYLYHFLQANEVPSAGYSRHFKFLKRLKVPVPPLNEQKRIAAILDKADALRQKRKKTIELLNSLTQSIFDEEFGSTFSRTSEHARLGEVCTKITDGTHQAPNWSSSGIPFLFVSNIRGQKISFDTKKHVSEDEYNRLTKSTPIEIGDVLYTAVGSYGHSAIVSNDKKFVFQRHIAQLKPNHKAVDPVYLSIALEAPAVRRQADKAAKGVAQKTVTLTSLKDFSIPLPSMDKQKKFAHKASEIRTMSASHRHGLTLADNLFNTLQHSAFAGEL